MRVIFASIDWQGCVAVMFFMRVEAEKVVAVAVATIVSLSLITFQKESNVHNN